MSACRGPDEVPILSSFGAACETCKRPDMSNMTWQDGVKNFFSTFLATPRMGPIGYILNSPYSPLRLEVEIPIKNWRESFEDLLAIDTGGEMISNESRMAETAAAIKGRYNFANDCIAMNNHWVQQNLKFESAVLKIRDAAAKKGNHEEVAQIDNKILSIVRSDRANKIKDARQDKDDFDAIKYKPASYIKSRGQWVASLITSGALPGWYSVLENSIEGHVMTFARHNAPPELDAGITISEEELLRVFEQGQPHGFGTPQPLPQEKLRALGDGSLKLQLRDEGFGLLDEFKPSPFSIIRQIAFTERVTRSDGTSSTKVVFSNQLANGKIVTKEHGVQDMTKVYEEVDNAYNSMEWVRQLSLYKPEAAAVDQLDHAVEPILASFGDDPSF